jgi:hypothetical protein
MSWQKYMTEQRYSLHGSQEIAGETGRGQRKIQSPRTGLPVTRFLQLGPTK